MENVHSRKEAAACKHLQSNLLQNLETRRRSSALCNTY